MLTKKSTIPKEKIKSSKLESTPIKWWLDEHQVVQLECDKDLSPADALKQVTGTKDQEVAGSIILSGARALLSSRSNSHDKTQRDLESLNVLIQNLNDFKPRDATEARLVTQATVAFEQAMSLTKKAMDSEMLSHLESLTNLSIKFMRVHNETVEALNRYRRGGEQKVIVTHVAEKMAILNNYGYPREG